ncbi:hypothetical protein [Vulcanisaeta souniana]|uniref:SCP2 domain-containing protein n=1 Tax=Vulcanisaeta souniana JCM 11219 TaxID=1293586 RepID=A0A830E5Q6_9CREN|nr:hypothetical protein [Vulcanisaeta souniana]BDR91537.1 hypothetical protein Vsou_06300 [Vulcanisaeta souniana JCM 11219]GGI73936.1 hypothetical protein GCM10007112_08480 [Vulcanisaeta souniana JCM 11219]
MSYIFPSEEWVKALCLSLNNDKEFLGAINGWNIEVLLVGKNLSNEVIKYLSSTYGTSDIKMIGILLKFNNSCKEVSLLINPEINNYHNVVIADYDIWLKVLDGLNDPVTTMLSMFKKLEVRGSMMTLVRLAANTISPMAKVIRRIPTKILR